MTGRRWVLFGAVSALVIVMLIGGMTAAYLNDTETSTSNTARAYADWTDFAWRYRKPIDISGNGTALTDYQLKLTVDTASLVSAAKMQSDGDDIRFATTAPAYLDYWIESGMNSASTVIWVEVDSIASAGTTRIYMYYGNASATAASDGDATFVFYDDFESGIGKWTMVNSNRGAISQVSSPVVQGSYAMLIDDTASNGPFGAYASFANQSACIIEYYARPAQTNQVFETRVQSGNTVGPHMRFNTDATYEYVDTSWRDFVPAFTYAADTWYKFRLDEMRVDTDRYDIYIDDTQYADDIAFDNVMSSVNRLLFYAAINSHTPDLYVDLVIVRAYASPVPSYTMQTEQ